MADNKISGTLIKTNNNVISEQLWNKLDENTNNNITLEEWNEQHKGSSNLLEDIINSWNLDTTHKNNISNDEKKLLRTRIVSAIGDSKGLDRNRLDNILKAEISKAVNSNEADDTDTYGRKGTNITDSRYKDIWEKGGINSVFDYYDRMDSGDVGKLGDAEGHITNPFMMTDIFWSKHKDWDSKEIDQTQRDDIKTAIEKSSKDNKLSKSEFTDIWKKIEEAALITIPQGVDVQDIKGTMKELFPSNNK